VSLKVVWKLLC